MNGEHIYTLLPPSLALSLSSSSLLTCMCVYVCPQLHKTLPLCMCPRVVSRPPPSLKILNKYVFIIYLLFRAFSLRI